MNSKLIGTCVFRNDGDGCLTSKYVNTDSPPFVEACKFEKDIPKAKFKNHQDAFCGEFQTIWIELSRHVSGTLVIDKLFDGRYELKWTSANANFEGIGMRYGDLLVAAYWLV